MTDPQPYTESLESQVARLARFIMAEIPDEPSEGQGAVDAAIRLLRNYQRVLAENEHLRHSAEILNDEVLLGIDKVATIALLQEYGGALNAGKPYPGTGGGLLLNAADMMVNLAQHLKRERAEVAALREQVRMLDQQWSELETCSECGDHHGKGSLCEVCMGQQVAALRADAQRWRFVRGRGQLTVTEDGEPILCVWFAEEELPDVLVPLVMSDEGTKNPTDLDDAVDMARSDGEGEG